MSPFHFEINRLQFFSSDKKNQNTFFIEKYYIYIFINKLLLLITKKITQSYNHL